MSNYFQMRTYSWIRIANWNMCSAATKKRSLTWNSAKRRSCTWYTCYKAKVIQWLKSLKNMSSLSIPFVSKNSCSQKREKQQKKRSLSVKRRINSASIKVTHTSCLLMDQPSCQNDHLMFLNWSSGVFLTTSRVLKKMMSLRRMTISKATHKLTKMRTIRSQWSTLIITTRPILILVIKHLNQGPALNDGWRLNRISLLIIYWHMFSLNSICIRLLLIHIVNKMHDLILKPSMNWPSRIPSRQVKVIGMTTSKMKSISNTKTRLTDFTSLAGSGSPHVLPLRDRWRIV